MNTLALPHWRGLLAVVAHPDDESFGLGAVLSAFVTAGSTVSVLCLTRGEASTLHAVAGDLADVRALELQRAAEALGITRVGLLGFPDSELTSVPLEVLVDAIATFADGQAADGILVFDPNGITGHPDHQRATEAALTYGHAHAIPVLAWTLPQEVADALRAETGAPFSGHAAQEIDMVIDVDRTTQERAVACHPSQAVPGSVLWRRLELLGPREHLRWLHHPNPGNDTPTAHPTVAQKERKHTMNVLMIINGSAYGLDSTYNAIRLTASMSKRDGVDVTVFLMGDGVTAAMAGQKTPDGYYKLDRMLSPVTRSGGQILCCGTCMDARGITSEMLIDGAQRSTMEALTDATLAADKVLVF